MEALFVLMEIAAAEQDTASLLRHAVALCERGGPSGSDARVRLAERRIRQLAENTAAFRREVPRIQALLQNSRQEWPPLSQALLTAAMDGTPGLNPYALARGAGILTDWRVAGPLGRRALAGVDAEELSRNDALAQPAVEERVVENFQFPDGTLTLPTYLTHRGTFYAAAEFATLEAGARRISVTAAGPVEVYVDGAFVLKTGSQGSGSEPMDLAPGPHRVVVRFREVATPLQVRVAAEPEARAWETRAAAKEEAAYLQAALSREEVRASVTGPQADSEAAWLRLVEDHPTCETLQQAAKFFAASGKDGDAREMEARLDGCAPESLAYARLLAGQGRHAQAAAVLRKLLKEFPLHREARQRMIAELQLSGQEEAAQRAAADWVRIAPNAGSYRRLAAFAQPEGSESSSPPAPFYLPFRRQAVMPPEEELGKTTGSTVVALDDHVAMARRDGSVSLYVHRFEIARTQEGAARLAQEQMPKDAQMIRLRRDGPAGAGASLEMEYVLYGVGDGGIAQHPEMFQHVFAASPAVVLSSRFAVVTPSDESDQRTVIETGNAPAMQSQVADGMLQRVWEWNNSVVGFAVVRVVDHENGWSVPRSAERRKKIDTTHPGPRPVDAKLEAPEVIP
jgi:hypothetical protein